MNGQAVQRRAERRAIERVAGYCRLLAVLGAGVVLLAIVLTQVSAADGRTPRPHGPKRPKPHFVPRGVSYNPTRLPPGVTASQTGAAHRCGQPFTVAGDLYFGSGCRQTPNSCTAVAMFSGGPPTRASFSWAAFTILPGSSHAPIVPGNSSDCDSARGLVRHLGDVQVASGVVIPLEGWRCEVRPDSATCTHGPGLVVATRAEFASPCRGAATAPGGLVTRSLFHWKGSVTYSPSTTRYDISAGTSFCAAAKKLIPRLQRIGATGGLVRLPDQWICQLTATTATCRRPDGLTVATTPGVRVTLGHGANLTGGPGTVQHILVLGVSVVAAPAGVRYFLLVGRHACGGSAGSTEQAMLRSHGLILAIGRSSFDYQTLFLRKLPPGRYYACYFLQPSGAARRPEALGEAIATVKP